MKERLIRQIGIETGLAGREMKRRRNGRKVGRAMRRNGEMERKLTLLTVVAGSAAVLSVWLHRSG